MMYVYSTAAIPLSRRRRRSMAGGMIVALLLAGPAFARAPSDGTNQTALVSPVVAAKLLATVRVISLDLVPLSTNQLAGEAAKGLPDGTPAIVAPKPGGGSVRLWDEVPPMRVITTPTSETLSVNVVY